MPAADFRQLQGDLKQTITGCGMIHKIFFSWQSDTPGVIGRNLIFNALQDTVAASGGGSDIEQADRTSDDALTEAAAVGYAVDMDTKGVSGSPPIVETIFKKVDSAAIFVADLTFAGKRLGGNPTPNPNVLIEYGWALKRLGYGRIISVMNTAFGSPKEQRLPFDLEHLRHPLQYFCAVDADEGARKKARVALAKDLQRAIKAVFESEEFKQSLPKPAPLPRFQAQQPKDGRGRFRAAGSALGANDRSRMEGMNPDIFLVDGAATWLRVMPEFETGRRWPVMELRDVAKLMPNEFVPLIQVTQAYRYFRASDGFGMCGVAAKAGGALDAVFAFCTGEIWSVDAWLMPANAQNSPALLTLNEDDFIKPLSNYANFLSRLGAPPPYRWIAGIEDTKNRHLRSPRFQSFNRVCLLDFIEEEGSYTPGDDPEQALRPFFSKIYDSCGLQRPGQPNG